MYPAAGLLDELFTYEDLPDQLIYKGRTGGDVTFNKLDPPLEFGSSFAYYISTTSPPYGSGDEDVIIIEDNANWLNWISADLNVIGLCLIEGYEETSGTADVFLDTYSYTVVFNGNTLQSGTISRDSLCVWTNKDLPPGFHKGIVYNPETYKFEILDPDEVTGEKTSPHNTPVGEYVQGNLGGLYDGAITTISA